ncbi:MAG: type II toxin-antitoxin system HicB family antitoxin [Patescibacteria group bacterium]|jgi:predicted RNase H-like HicB family nuclease
MLTAKKKLKKIKIMEYPAVFEPAGKCGYNVSFPSFPGCVTFGRNFEEAKIKAKEVLELWLEELTERGEAVPASAARPIIDQIRVSLPGKVKLSYAANNC